MTGIASLAQALASSPDRQDGVAGMMDADTWDTTFACLMSVIFVIVVPWDYVRRHFVTARGDRWR